MKFSTAILRILAVFVAVSVAQFLAGALVALLLPPKEGLPHLAQHFAQWMFLSNAITIGALSVLALRSEWRGWTLGAALAGIPLAITLVDGLEGVYFLPHSPIDWSRIFAQSTLAAVLSVPVWMLLFGRRPAPQQDHYHPIATKSRRERAWKFVVCDLAYLLLYFTAGSIIWPYVKDFYASQTLPPMPTFLVLELLVRAPAFIVLCLLLVRMLGLPRLSGALAAGAVFALLSGVAPLLMPNPYFPDVVRWAHFCETTSSNFVFAALVAWLWGQPKVVHANALAQAA
ncbi:MAG: hypothetical protein ABSF93_09580 [Candidatus Sulfotelmatobacter sp.]